MASYDKPEGNKFCSNCGSQNEKQEEHIDHYDRVTGSPVYRYMLRCPNKTWFNNCFNEQFESNEEGDFMIVSYDY